MHEIHLLVDCVEGTLPASTDKHGDKDVTVTPERIAKLQALGLSEYGARAFIALLALGPATARDIGTLGRVPMGKIYRALDQLHERGLVDVLPETPKRFAPIPIGGFIMKMQREYEATIRALENERRDLETEFEITGNAEINDKGGFSVVRGRKNAIAAFLEGLADTSSELFCIVTEGFALRSHAYLPELERARARGVNLRFLVPITNTNARALEPLSRIGEIRHRHLGAMAIGAHTAIHLHDAKRALAVTLAPDDASLHSGKDVGIVTDQVGIVAAVESLAEIAWAEAPDFGETASNVRAGRAPVFTRTYRTRGETARVLASRLASGVDSFAYVNTDPADHSERDDLNIVDVLAMKNVDARAILAIKDADGTRPRAPIASVRYVDDANLSRFILIDGHEAIFPAIQRATAVPSPDSFADKGILRVHTNDPAIVEPLLKQFSEMWGAAKPADARKDARGSDS